MNAGNYREALNRAPPRLSDVAPGPARNRVLRERHEANVETWLRNREPRPFLAPLRAWLARRLGR